MELVPSFQDVVQRVSFVMTAPTLASFLIVLAGRVFARRCTVTRVLLAANAVKTPGFGGVEPLRQFAGGRPAGAAARIGGPAGGRAAHGPLQCRNAAVAIEMPGPVG